MRLISVRASVRRPSGRQGRRGRGAVLASLALAATVHTASPAGADKPVDGSVDPRFGVGGSVTTDLGGEDQAREVAVQRDGRIVAAGWTRGPEGESADYDFAVARYTRHGRLDRRFGDGGKVTTDFLSGGNDRAEAVVVQPDGKVVVAGTTAIDPFRGGDFALARYTRDGSLDTSFGDGGRVVTDPSGGSEDSAYAMVLQPDGKLVVAGVASVVDGPAHALVRYNPDGSLDASFGSGGTVLSLLTRWRANALAIQPDGKLIAGGAAGFDDPGFGLVRYEPDGSVDETFGTGGLVRTDILPRVEEINDLVVQPDGKIAAAGFSLLQTPQGFDTLEFALARYHPDGSLDTGFGRSGIVLTQFGDFRSLDWDVAEALVLQPDGKLIAAGHTGDDLALARYHADGSLDATFGIAGQVTGDFGGAMASAAFAATLQRDGKLVLAGVASSGPDIRTPGDFALARFHTSTRRGA